MTAMIELATLTAPIFGTVIDDLERIADPDAIWPIEGHNKKNWFTNGTKTHCTRGHEFTAENTYVSPEGFRMCRKCKRLWVLSNRA